MKLYDYKEKKCTGCNKVKLLTEFNRDRSLIDGKSGRCKECKPKRDFSKYAARRKELDQKHRAFGLDSKFGDTWIHLHASILEWATSQRATH